MKITSSPHNLLMLTGTLYFIVSFFFLNQTMNIHLDDTYFIIALTYMMRFIAVSLLLFWIIYKVLNKYLSGFLSWTHIISTLIASILILTFNTWSNEIYSTNGVVGIDDLREFQRYNTILSMLTVMLVAGQFLFFINLARGLAKKLNKKS